MRELNMIEASSVSGGKNPPSGGGGNNQSRQQGGQGQNQGQNQEQGQSQEMKNAQMLLDGFSDFCQSNPGAEVSFTLTDKQNESPKFEIGFGDKGKVSAGGGATDSTITGSVKCGSGGD